MALSKSMAGLYRLSICHRIALTSVAGSSHRPRVSVTRVSPPLLVRFNSSGPAGLVKDAIVSRPSIKFDLPEDRVVPKEEISAFSEKEVIDLSQFLVTSDKAPAPEITEALSNVVTSGALTAADLNLTWWCPTNLVYIILEGLHTYCPWWATIIIYTICVRILVFPLVIRAQKNAAKMSYQMPEIQKLQMKMSEARRSGNAGEVQKLAFQLQTKMKDMNMMQNFLLPVAQTPIFLSTFFVLRELINYPNEAMKYEGLLWFTNLTQADPYFLLPTLTASTLFVMLKWGVEFGTNPMNAQIQRFMTMILPPITFMFTCKFGTALLIHWCTSNLLSLLQVTCLRQEPIRKFFNIPKVKKWDKSELPPTKSFTSSFKESIENQKLARRLSDRRTTHERQFQQAGIAPLQKTYKKDPTKSAQ